MSRAFLFLLLLAGLIVGLLVFAPLGTVLRLSGAKAPAVSWDYADGSIMEGHIQGLEIEGQQYGDATLQLQVTALLSGTLRYAVEWVSDHGRGFGDLSAGSNGKIALQNFKIDLDLLQLEQAALWIQQSGGRVQLEGEIIRFKENQCVNATGIARSDVLERNREILGPGWTNMRGDLRCESGDLVIQLASENGSGTRFLSQLRIAPGRPSRFDARVSGILPRELDYALPIAGFAKDGRSYVYSYSTSVRSGPT